MTSMIVKYLFKRNVNLKVGGNPYFLSPNDTKFKDPPPNLSKHDLKVFLKIRRRAYRLDESITCCCCHARFGWSSIISLIPLIGDIIDLLLSRHLINLAESIDGGLPPFIRAQMSANLIMDFIIGLVPVVGAIGDMIYKANTRNLKILEKHFLGLAQPVVEN